MANFRIWHASQDPYHCAFRMVRLLLASTSQISIERLRVLDVLLLYPALLHRVRLTEELKKQLRNISIERPEQSFIRLPSLASVWQDLQIYQSVALKHLVGRGLLQREALLDKVASLDERYVPDEILNAARSENRQQMGLLALLTEGLSALPDAGADGLMRRAHLPARGPVL